MTDYLIGLSWTATDSSDDGVFPKAVYYCPDGERGGIVICEGCGFEAKSGEFNPNFVLVRFHVHLRQTKAQWFISFLERMAAGEKVALEEIQAKHHELFGYPMKATQRGLGFV